VFEGFTVNGERVSESRVAFKGIGEAWTDKNIGTVYRSSRMYGFFGFSHKFHEHYSVYTEAGFARVDSSDDETALQLIPLTIGATILFGSERVEPFIGVGASLVNYMEEISTGSISGTKLGVDIRTGVRIGTRFVRKSQHPRNSLNNPNTPNGPKQMDVELMLGQRIHHAMGIGTGLDLGATRFGVGLQFRL
jgi:hypothetical protein